MCIRDSGSGLSVDRQLWTMSGAARPSRPRPGPGSVVQRAGGSCTGRAGGVSLSSGVSYKLHRAGAHRCWRSGGTIDDAATVSYNDRCLSATVCTLQRLQSVVRPCNLHRCPASQPLPACSIIVRCFHGCPATKFLL